MFALPKPVRSNYNYRADKEQFISFWLKGEEYANRKKSHRCNNSDGLHYDTGMQ
jgi:hypothetical protein